MPRIYVVRAVSPHRTSYRTYRRHVLHRNLSIISSGSHQAVIIQVKGQPELTYKLDVVLDEETRDLVGDFRCPSEACHVTTRSFSEIADHHLTTHR